MFNFVEKLIALVAAGLLFVLMIVTFVDVVGRNLLNYPLRGASEFTEISLAIIIFLMLPRVALRNRHIMIDLVENVSGPRMLRSLDVLAGLGAALFFAIVAWQMWGLGTRATGFGDVSSSLHIPLGAVLYGIAILLGVNALAHIVAIVRAPEPPSREGAPDAPQSIV